MPVKVAHISSAHPVKDSRVFYRECVSLSKAGYDVSLVGLGDQEDGVVETVVEGVKVTALPRPRSRWGRLFRSVPAAYAMARRIDAEIYHLHDPEMVPAGALLRARGKKVIFDVHEYFPGEAYGKHYLPRWGQHIASFGAHCIFWLARKTMSAIIPVHQGIADAFPGQKIAIVQNFPEYEEFAPSEKIVPPPYDDRPPVAVFSGALNRIRSAVEIVRAFDSPLMPPEAQLQILGRITEASLEKELRAMPGWSRVDYAGWVDPSEVGVKTCSARMGLVLFYPLPNHINAQPRKLFEYMASGLPVIASDFPHWRNIIGDIECGLLVDPLDPEAIAKAIAWIFEHPEEAAAMGRRGQEAARETYNWEIERRKLIGLYEDLSGAGNSAG